MRRYRAIFSRISSGSCENRGVGLTGTEAENSGVTYGTEELSLVAEISILGAS